MNEAAACAALAVLVFFSACHGTGAFKAFPRVGRSGDFTWDYENDALKSKRQAGLFPFPRVGRSGDLTWEFAPGVPGYVCPTCFGPRGRVSGAPADALHVEHVTPSRRITSESNAGEGKRQGLIPFPRVGRAGPASAAAALAGGAGAAAPARFRMGAAPLPPAAALLLMDAAAPELARRAGGGAGGNGGGGDAGGGGGGDNDGMWFGPRLGRRSRRSLALEGPWTIVPLRELSPPQQQQQRRHDAAGGDSAEDAEEEDDASALADADASDETERRGAADAAARPVRAADTHPRRG